MKKRIKNILLLALLVGFVSCSDNNDVTGETIVTSGVYIADLSLQTETGENNEILSRGVDQSAGVFTDEYPLDYIYIHSADASDKDHKSLKIPLKKEEAEDGDVKQKAVHLELEVLGDGAYIVGFGDEANVIKFGSNEKVYFSTLETLYWEAKVQGATPVTGSDVFVEDAKNNIELLRSAESYDRAGLETLLKKPSIELTRCTTGFKVYFMFTDVKEKITETGDRQYVISKDSWKQEVGYAPENFLIKDNGSKYFRAQIPAMSTELNRIHYVILVYSYKDLKKAFLEDSQSIKTRSPWSGPEKMELTPAEVIVR